MIKQSSYLLSAILFMLTIQSVHAQGIVNHQQPNVVERNTTQTFQFELTNMTIASYQEAFLYYKFIGDAGYSQTPAELVGDGGRFSASLRIPENAGSNLSYYFVATLNTGEQVSYPVQNPTSQPVQVNVVDQEEQENLTGTENNIDFNVLSPLPDERVVSSDALIAVALFYDEESQVEPSDFTLSFDGVDVSDQAEITAYLVTYRPENLRPGNYTATLSYTINGEKKTLTEWSFPVVDQSQAPIARDPFMAGGSRDYMNTQVELLARNQSIALSSQDIYNGRVRVNGRKGWLRYSANGYLTSQEESRLQPMNRYGVELYGGDVFELQAGHVYPTISPLMIAGNRVLGVNTGLHLLNRNLNFRFVYGQMKRAVSNIYQGIDVDESILNPNTAQADTSYSYQLNLAQNGRGTYQRDIIAGRFAIGNGDVFQFGLNAMKVSDDQASLNTIRGYDGLIGNNDLMTSLSSQDLQRLQQDNTLLSTPTANPKPKENFAFGGDLALNANNGNIRFRTDFGASLVNEDISPGLLNNERAQDLGFGDLGDAGNIIDQLSWLIVINENMSYLPFAFTADGVEIETNKFLFMSDVPVPTSILASQSSLSLNYFGNNLTAKYSWIGPDYVTLASTALRRDISGFNIQDRFQLLSNTVYVTLGYENLNNNLSGTELSTTNTVAYNGDISWFPMPRNLPRISAGFRTQSRDNGLSRFNPNVSQTFINSAVRNLDENLNLVDAPKDLTTNQFNFSVRQAVNFAGLSNDINLSMFVINTEDNGFKYGDFNSTSVSLGFNTDFSTILPLRTNVGYTLNSSESISGLFEVDVSGINLGAQYYMFDNMLVLNANIAMTGNEISGQNLEIDDNGTPDEYLDDYYKPSVDGNGDPVITKTNQSSFVVGGGASWNMTDNHSLRFNASLTNVNSSLEGINIPNDQYAQVRYIYSF